MCSINLLLLYLLIYLSTSIYMLLHLFIDLYVYLYVWLDIFAPIFPSVNVSIHESVYVAFRSWGKSCTYDYGINDITFVYSICFIWIRDGYVKSFRGRYNMLDKVAMIIMSGPTSRKQISWKIICSLHHTRIKLCICSLITQRQFN